MGLLDTARRNGIDRGLLGTSRGWLVVGAAAWGIRAFQRARRPEGETVTLEVLQPGETIVISHGGPPASRRRRRQDARLERRLRRAERKAR